MKVILNQAVPKLGKEGQVVTVADGFARNFLFPRGLATFADKGQLSALEKRQTRMAAKHAETLSAAEKVKGGIDGKTVNIQAKVGKDAGRLFGAITAQDVADAIKSQLKLEIDRKKIGLVQPIKRLGVYPVELDLHHSVDAIVHINVFDPDAPAEEVAAEAPAAEATQAEEAVAVEA
jgi:large subunit ribosomal protein L9